MKYISLFIFCALAFYSCSYPEDNLEPKTTYKQTATIGDFMYQVEADLLSTFDITDPNNIKMVDERRLSFRIESLTSFGDVLFIGSGISLISFKINTAGVPVQDNVVPQMTFSPDQTVCDLMAVDNNLAFVALINHNAPNQICTRSMNDNTIQVYNIATLSNPTLLSSLVLTDVKDVAVDGVLLFVSDGTNGFKIYNLSDPSNLVELYSFDDFNTQDVVINDGMLIVAGSTELRQYDYSDISDIREISRIEL